MEVILMHWVTFISHIIQHEYHEAAVFRSIPNCVYVLEVIETRAASHRTLDKDEMRWDERIEIVRSSVEIFNNCSVEN